jgi:hypothetical protein
LVSAVTATRKMKKGTTPSRMTFHCHRCCAWASTMVRVDRAPVMRTTVTTDSPIAASYEIIWADARTEPRSGYLEPEDQPASMIP